MGCDIAGDAATWPPQPFPCRKSGMRRLGGQCLRRDECRAIGRPLAAETGSRCLDRFVVGAEIMPVSATTVTLDSW